MPVFRSRPSDEIAVSAAAAATGTGTAVSAAGLANERLAKLTESSEEQTATAGEISSGVAAVAQGAALSAQAVEELRRAADFVSDKSRQLNELFAS